MSWAEERTGAESAPGGPSLCLTPEQGRNGDLTWPHALQVDFPLYDPPVYSAEHKDMAMQDPFSP